ncbi:MAG: hypothetical protein WC645_05290 [Candidatus Margulisiibacteriota bacterium]
MTRRGLLLFSIFYFLFSTFSSASLRDQPFEPEYKTPEFIINFQPAYPLVVGEDAIISIKTPLVAENIYVGLPDGQRLKLHKKQDSWTGRFTIDRSANEGWQILDITIQHKVPADYVVFTDRLLGFLGRAPAVSYRQETLTRRLYFRAFKPLSPVPAPPSPPPYPFLYPAIPTRETLALEIYPKAEAVTPEAQPLIIRGSRLFSFSSKSIEGTKEGYLPGTAREESLRVNVSGKVQDTEIEANFFSTSSIGTTLISSREEKVSVLLKHASTEAYFGDYTADLTDVEFAKLTKRLSGVKLSGDYDKWGFKAIASNPQGQSRLAKFYGDGTQGPYNLGSSPVVIDSERVRVDGALQRRGDDYTIDYNAGTITFNNRSIINISIIEVTYDYRQTLYQHYTYALRGTKKINSNLSLGATWIDDSDSTANAADIFSSQLSGTVEPQSHYVVGVDGSYLAGDLLSLNGELAYSEKKLNLLAADPARSIGKAGKFGVASSLGPFGFRGSWKKVGSQFEPVAEAAPRQDVLEYSGLLSFRPNELLLASGSYDHNKYAQSGTEYKNVNRSAKARLTPARLPSLEYLFDEREESNDYVTAAFFNRLTTKNSGELLHKIGKINLSAKAAQEKRLVRSPSDEATTFRTAALGASLGEMQNFSAAGNYEFKETELPSGTRFPTKTYNLDLSLTPRKEYLLSAIINYIDDAELGVSNSTDLTFRAEPTDKVKTDGKYTISALTEPFGSTSEAVTKQIGSIRLELRPAPPLRLRYYYKPNYTILNRTQGITYNNETNQYEMNWQVLSQTMIGATYKTGTSFSIDKTDYPNFSRKQSTSDLTSQLYTLKTAPLRFLSTEFNYIREDTFGTTLTATTPAYSKSNGRNREISAAIKTSLSERFAIDSLLSYRISQTGTGESFSDATDIDTQTYSLKGIFNASDFWTFSASLAYSKSTNRLAAANADTYTYTPGAGFIYRYFDIFRVDGDYTYSKSYAGASTERILYSLRAKYDLSEYIHITVRGDREVSFYPDYKTTDILGNIEINL